MENIDFSLVKYDNDRQTIRVLYEDQHKTKEEILTMAKNQFDNNCSMLTVKNINEFNSLLERVIEDIEEKKRNRKLQENTTLRSDEENNEFKLVDSESATWGAFKKRLEDKKFKNIDTIEEDVKDIVVALKDNTFNNDPFKGLVIGNVQSGKTNNMEGVISAAGDNGINLFIVISGVIKNLKEQTDKRFVEDIRALKDLNLHWNFLDLRNSTEVKNKIANINFDTNNRYIAIVLKQKNWLEDLNNWIRGGSQNSPDLNKMKQMKVLIIDDEADQASINTNNIDNEKEIQDERSKINNEIIKLVNDKRFCAMNYLAYTATPYANVLNEYQIESLYPRNLIKMLTPPSNYFGAKQIFGYDEQNEIEQSTIYSGLDIIREITEEDIENIIKLHKGTNVNNIKIKSLDRAICWFLITAAYFRKRSIKEPVSMLIHTSHKVAYHSIIEKYVINFFKNNQKDLMEMCKNVYEIETKRFTLQDFKDQFSQYDSIEMQDYISFDGLKEELEKIIDDEPSGIPCDSDGRFNFTKDGVFICVDNSSNSNMIDDVYYRLAYPEKDEKLDKAPIFIVIGGNTLSRGLTIEGLTTSYFVRSTLAADTLMQMGRWFGYRRKYELYQRIFLTNKTKEAFVELTKLEEELRKEINDMKNKGLLPKDYPPRVENITISVTSKRKMQSSKICDFDYSSNLLQIFKFDRDNKIIKENNNTLNDFIYKIKNNTKVIKERILFYDVKFEFIKEFLEKFNINKDIRSFSNKEALIEWLDKCDKEKDYENWDVMLSTTKNGNASSRVGDYEVNWCTRTALKQFTNKDSFNIGVLNNPNDMIIDIEDKKDENLIKLIEEYKKKGTKFILNKIRNIAGKGKNPLLVIYLIDPQSKVINQNKEKRISLSELFLGTDPIPAFSIFLPGDNRRVKNYTKSISVPIEGLKKISDNDIEE